MKEHLIRISYQIVDMLKRSWWRWKNLLIADGDVFDGVSLRCVMTNS